MSIAQAVALPCIPLAYPKRLEAEATRRTYARRGLAVKVSYCQACDQYHLLVIIATDSGAQTGNAWLRKADVSMLQMLAQGYTRQEVAKAMGSSRYTLRNRLETLFRRFYALNTTHLIAIVMRLGLFDGAEFVPIVTKQTHA